MVILIPVETAVRELPYKTYLAHLLALNGFECFLGSKHQVNYLVNKFDNFIYLDKGYHEKKSEKNYANIKKNNGFIISLDEEGAVDYDSNNTIKKRYGVKLFKSVEKVFFWGRNQHDLIDKNIMANSKTYISGHPRFELLKPAYQSIYDEEKKDILNRFGKFILINTNMGFGNNIRGDEFVLDGYGKWFENIKDIVYFDKQKMELFKELIQQLLNNYEGNVILRPHPEEEVGYYKKLIQNSQKFHVEHKGSVVPWILASEAMIHPDCTTAIETLMLGKKPISLLPPRSNSKTIAKLPVEVSLSVANIRDILRLIKNLDNDTSLITKNDHKVLEDWFSISNNSSKFICQEISALRSSMNGNTSGDISLWDKMYLQIRDYRHQNSNILDTKITNKKLQGFNWDHVTQLKNKFLHLNRKFKDIQIVKISSRLIRLNHIAT